MSDVAYVYFIQAVGSGRIKVGHSTSLESRVDQLVTNCPFPVSLTALLECDKDDMRYVESIARVEFLMSCGVDAHNEWIQIEKNAPPEVITEFLYDRADGSALVFERRKIEYRCELIASMNLIKDPHSMPFSYRERGWRSGSVANQYFRIEKRKASEESRTAISNHGVEIRYD